MRDHLATLLDDFRRYAGDTAVVRFKGNRRKATTYGELARLSGRFATLLAKRGVESGDRVLIWGENSAEWIAAFYGCVLRGAVAVPLDAYGSADFASRVCADVKPKLAVGDAQLLRQLTCEFPRLALDELPALLPAEEAGPVAGLARSTPLQILFTSGTTGEPKGIVHTHGNVLASAGPIEKAAQNYLFWERFVHPLRILNTLPLSHVFGQMMGLWVPPIFAAEVHFEHRLAAPRLVEGIRRERISVVAAVPRVLALLKTHLEINIPGLDQRMAGQGKISGIGKWWKYRDVHREFGLRFVTLISGGGALPGPLEQFWNAMGFLLVQGYGMTETTALITLNHPFHVASGSIGKPLEGREVKLAPDGEVLVRGESISGATWSGGQLRQRANEWLATGDLAERGPGGELRFLGRKSEVIVTGAGVNVHPEDLESAVEQEPGVMACAVVPVETPQGPEPVAVLAMRGPVEQAGAAIEHANARLAEFQRIRRWEVWPDPDLPRTSTGKVRRKAVSEWLAAKHATGNGAGGAGMQASAAVAKDWLLALIAQITGEAPPEGGDELRLSEDLHLDSLGRVQLTAAIEEKQGTAPADGSLDQVETLGELRRVLHGLSASSSNEDSPELAAKNGSDGAKATGDGRGGELGEQAGAAPEAVATVGNAEAEINSAAGAAAAQPASERWGAAETGATKRNYLYSHWPWWWPVRWLRNVFTEAVMRPLVWLLAKPRVVALGALDAREPMLIVANHVTAYDGPLIKYALPGRLRRPLAVAMSGEMLEDFRHSRNPESGRFYPQGPLFYWLVTAFFNVFPLPRLRDFHRSFEHAGEALDRGMSVLVFPEGARSPEGTMARFRQGVGLLVKLSDAPVLPVALVGLGELKVRNGGWFRSGTVEVRVGEPIRFGPDATESAITTRLQEEVEKLMGVGTRN